MQALSLIHIFPTNYWQFCHELKNNGMNVLGIGDQPYDELKPELKDSLNEYYNCLLYTSKIVPGQKIKRPAREERAAEADQLPLGQPE